MTRHVLREHIFKILFCIDFYPLDEIEEQILNYFDSIEADELAASELKTRIDRIVVVLPEIDRLIEENTEGWKLKRIGKVELNILRLAVFEMKYDDDIPEKVAINEAVELAKKFGGDESPVFVNGVLAKLI